jgi:hypothetical protein
MILVQKRMILVEKRMILVSVSVSVSEILSKLGGPIACGYCKGTQ